uniref:Uncharacterized protein n=1 Tax=Daphnia galeata TaxID=27404 RepID=A0A8J2S8I5_9CRUS|nr:unnamed protein product [Daphnia galeata]
MTMASSTEIVAYWLFFAMTLILFQDVVGSPIDLSDNELRTLREIGDSTDYEREERVWTRMRDFFGGFYKEMLGFSG